MRLQHFRSGTRRLTRAGGLFLGYVCAAKLGLLFASVQPNATAIWPPTGIAIAAGVLLGADAWLVIFAGAFLVNLTTAGSIATSLGIAVGNMLEGMLGAYVVEHWADGRRAFMRAPNVFRFAALAGLLSPAVSATIGVTSLSLGGYASWSLYGPVWLTWWLGDVAGALLVAPLILAWSAETGDAWRREQWLEATLLFAAVVGSAVLVFGGVYAPTSHYPLAFLCIPALVWAAFRFGPRETAASMLVLSGIATWGTLRGLGPFAIVGGNNGLLVLQAFMATTAVTALVMAALVRERRALLGAEQKARVGAERTNRAKDEFLAMLGHELRNPLSAITMALEVVDHAATLKGKAAHAQAIIGRQLGQLAGLVDELLDVTRVTTGKIVLNRGPVDLADVAARVLDTLSGTHRTRLHLIDLNAQAVWVDGDATRLEQVLTNLVANALKYTLPGGTIRLIVGDEQGQATLRVSDTGIGIAPDLIPQVFDVFVQEDRGLDRAQDGLGIGLTLVRYLVELHGGSVEARSDGPNRGSEFIVRLPAISPPVVSTRETIAASPSPQPNSFRRVLVVEEQADVRDSLRLVLEDAGYQVFEATDGPGAIEAVERFEAGGGHHRYWIAGV